MDKKNILVINGPNLNLLGLREVSIYGSETLESINSNLITKFSNRCNLTFFQSNHEGEIVSKIQAFKGNGIIINAAAYTHTSIAILDALKFTKETNDSIKIVEVHLSNIYLRDNFRHKSFISLVADATICGMKGHGYIYAIDYLLG